MCALKHGAGRSAPAVRRPSGPVVRRPSGQRCDVLRA